MCLAGCASSGLKIIPAGELGEAGGTPSISGVIDRGGGDIAGSGTLAPVTGDGIAVIGEVLHVRGRNFGRQPTVTIGGAATAVVARSADGGILVRVPPGTPAGQQRLVVTNEEGRTEHALTIRRLVMGRVGARLAWFNLAATGPTLVGETNVEGARATAMSRDGRAGYVIDGAGNLLTFELPAQGRPETRERLAVAQPVRALLAAPAVARLFVVAAESLIEIDTTMPLHPVLGATRPLPVRVHGSKPLPMAVSPDGRRLALALPERNRVMIVDVAALQGETPPAAELALAPEVLAPVLIDLTFAPDGRTLWVLSGSGPENQSVGPQPTRVHAIRITESPAGAPPTLAVARVVPIDAATMPQAIMTGNGGGLQSGAAIRLPPERATVHVAAYYKAEPRPQLFSVAADDVATPAPVLAPVGVVGRPRVSPDDGWLLAITSDPEGVNLMLAIPLTGAGRPLIVPLPGKSLARSLAEAPLSSRSSELQIQP